MDWIRKLLKYMYLLVMFLTRIFAIYIRPFFLHNKKSSFLPNLIFSVLKTSQKLKEFLLFFIKFYTMIWIVSKNVASFPFKTYFLWKWISTATQDDPMLKSPIVTGVDCVHCTLLKMLFLKNSLNFSSMEWI